MRVWCGPPQPEYRMLLITGNPATTSYFITLYCAITCCHISPACFASSSYVVRRAGPPSLCSAVFLLVCVCASFLTLTLLCVEPPFVCLLFDMTFIFSCLNLLSAFGSWQFFVVVCICSVYVFCLLSLRCLSVRVFVSSLCFWSFLKWKLSLYSDGLRFGCFRSFTVIIPWSRIVYHYLRDLFALCFRKVLLMIFFIISISKLSTFLFFLLVRPNLLNVLSNFVTSWWQNLACLQTIRTFFLFVFYAYVT